MKIPQPDIERIRYKPRQTLVSRDLNLQATVDAELTAWHNRAIHNSYGIIRGPRNPTSYEVEWTADGRALVVQPGVAYDCYGRPLVLTTPAIIRIEPQDSRARERLVLVVRAGASAFGSPEFAWVEPSRAGPRAGVPLAMLVFQGNGRAALDDRFSIQTLRPEESPRVVIGATLQRATNWQPWIEDGYGARRFGLQVRVDTTAYGFADAPVYVPQLRSDVLTARDGALLGRMVPHVDEVAADGFTFRLLGTERRLAGALVSSLAGYFRRILALEWMAVQPTTITTVGRRRLKLRKEGEFE